MKSAVVLFRITHPLDSRYPAILATHKFPQHLSADPSQIPIRRHVTDYLNDSEMNITVAGAAGRYFFSANREHVMRKSVLNVGNAINSRSGDGVARLKGYRYSG
jgi:hypothetical protein